ncbi:hypothetical protein IAR55_006508 [Kwoniella newhampshirensis]|uniref:Delta 8-(E)-sphingolipid desaturase n=1 Tax=Kwoniella newhampshirensis TaxID=1651941 RepID=A0AAW0YTE4_9TREE
MSSIKTDAQRRLLDRSDIAARITQGQQLIIYRSKVINTTPWSPYHPGGALALLHFVGRDATDEIEAYHSEPTLRRMDKFVVGRVEVDERGWSPLTPPIALGLVRHPDGVKGHWAREGAITLGQSILQQAISLDPSSAPIPAIPIERTTGPNPEVITLHPAQLEPPTSANSDLRKEYIRSQAYQELRQRIVDAGLFKPPGPLSGYGTDILRYLLLGGASLYLYFNTTGWIGQMSSAACLGLLFQQLAFVTNHPEHDPDIQHIPFFAISKDFFGSLWSSYYKRVMTLDAFAKILISIHFWVYELAGIAFYWAYYGSMLRNLPTWQMRVGYLLVSHVFASPVHVQLRTTMDVICSPTIEFIHGGLNLQVTHHLFPRLPRHNLREASLLVKEYCKEHEILYREHNFIEGNRHVLSTLKDVANQLQLLKQVADKEIKEKIKA